MEQIEIHRTLRRREAQGRQRSRGLADAAGISLQLVQQNGALHSHALAVSASCTPLNCHPTHTPVSLNLSDPQTGLA
jgi:hypothetical protein